MKRSLVFFVALLMLTCAGCNRGLRLEDDVTVANPDGLDRLIFGDYWEVDNIPAGVGANKMCIAEFNIEFVRERLLRLPDQRGLTSRTMKYETGLTKEVPGRLLEVFIDRVESRGRSVVPQRSVMQSKGYAQYPCRAADATALVRYDAPIPSANGKTRIAEVQPAAGMKLMQGDAELLASLDRNLAAELGAAVVRVQMRMGIHEGRATIEKGSRLVVTTPGGETGVLTSRRTLASHPSVITNAGYTPSPRGEFFVSKPDYLANIDRLFLNYIALATEVLE